MAMWGSVARGRRAWLLCGGAWVLGSGLSLPARATTVFHLGHQFPQGSIPDQAAARFAEGVAQRSQGALRVMVHPAAAFGDERDHIALLRKGQLDFAVTGDLVVSSLSDRYLVLNLPFLYRDAAHALAVYDGAPGQAMRAELGRRGLVALSWHFVGTRMLTANRPIHRLADLAGLNLRLPQDATWIAAWRALGAAPRQVQFTDLPAALKVGQVDAQENPPNFIRAGKLYENQKFLMTTNHMPQRQFVFGAEGVWSRLGSAQRRLLQAAATEASQFAVAVAQREHQRDLTWLVTEGGMSLVQFDAQGVAQALQRLPRDLAGAEGEALVAQIRAIR